jgi:hypothetical protein
VSFGERLFVFDGLFCGENDEVMKELIRATQSAPHTDAEALELTKLYLSFSYYQLRDPRTFVAIRGTDPTQKNDPASQAGFSDMIGVSHSPEVSRRDELYLVDLFTDAKMGAVGGPVTHWKIELGPASFKQKMAREHKGPLRKSQEEVSQKEGNKKGLSFTVDMMANGMTSDGAQTDIQSWSASDGPGVGRVHYYYHSHEKAERLMQDKLQNAVAVLQSDNWKDAAGRIAGKKALLVQANNDKKSLSASQLYEDEISVIEIYCSCLQTVLVSQGNDGPVKKY